MKQFFGILMGGAFLVGMAAFAPQQASAAGFGENFSIDQGCTGCSSVGGVITDIDNIGINYDAVIEQNVVGVPLDGNDPFTEVGSVTWGSYNNDSNAAIPGSALNFDYQVYGTFVAEGVAGLVNPTTIGVTFTKFEISFYYDADADSTFTLPTFTGTDLDSTTVAVANSGDDLLLFTASLLVTGEATTAPFGLAEGNFEVILTDLGLSLLGENFLFDPDPFYPRMNLAGNTQALTIVAGSTAGEFIAEQGGGGQLFFTVPEPGTLALLGIGLLGLGAVRRRQRA